MPSKVPPVLRSSSARYEDSADGSSVDGLTMRANGKDEEKPDGNGMLSNHKGKLAVGAAAMLGLAVYYKWREHMLAKEDPEEYRRLRRIAASVETGESQPGGKA